MAFDYDPEFCDHCICYHEYDHVCCDCGKDPFGPEQDTTYTSYVEDEDYYWDDDDTDDDF